MTNKPCPHKLLRKQLSGMQVWYVCECGQKFKAEAWGGKVAAAPAPPSREWQPMNTAPRDGTRILVDFGEHAGIHSVAWEEAASGITIWCVDDLKFGPYALRGYIETDVKGWQPLPAAVADYRASAEEK